MKKIILSAAVAAMALSTSAFAADKGIDIVTTGQAVIYYQTHADDGAADTTLFDQADSIANAGIQLNLDADLKNGFTFGSQLTYLGTAGLEKNVVGGTVQSANTNVFGGNTYDEISLTKIFVAKKIANTTLKLGRQELPKSLSPFAFSESWRVFKNTFDAILAVNTDIPDTTLVGAYVSGGTGSAELGTTGNLAATVTGNVTLAVTDEAYMLTVANKSIPMTALTLSYYDVSKVAGLDTSKDGATALWADAKVAGKDLPMGLKVGLQAGVLGADDSAVSDTTAFGAKIGLKPVDALALCVAFTSVDGDKNKGNIAVKNFGTGVKTPLYTQMLLNQDAIALDADTIMVKAIYNTGDYGKIIAQYSSTEAGERNLMGNETNYAELDLIYKVNVGGVQYFASYMNRNVDKGGLMGIQAAADAESDDVVRVWARYNF